MKSNNIEILERPDWVSWDDIHDVLWKAHAMNREKGINMAFPALPGDKICEMIEGGNGKMFVAVDKNTVVGTGAVIKKKHNLWCGKGEYGYLCFASVLPNYSSMGIYKQLREYIERETCKMGIDKVLFETHEGNGRMLRINSRNDYKMVDFKVTSTDHYNVLMVKWLDGCPYSDLYVKWQFLIRKWYRRLRYKPGRVKRYGI